MALNSLKKFKKTPSIKHMIHSALPHWEPARDDGQVHASDLLRELEFCPREWVLKKITGVKSKPMFIPTALEITFAHGRQIEYNLRNHWLAGHVVGNWSCGRCTHKHPTYGKMPKINCPTCNFYQWEYREVSFQSPISGVTGSLDTIVDTGEVKHRIVECKTIDKDEFKKLVAPMAEHKARTSLYMKLVEESELGHSGSLNTKEAHVLYVSKSYGFKDESLKEAGIKDFPFSPFKEYVVQRDDSLTETVLNRARLVYAFGKDPAVGVPCGVCSTGVDKRAQACPVRTQCWGAEYPPSLTWIEKGKPRHPGRPML